MTDTAVSTHTPGPWQNGTDDLEGVVSLGARDDGNVVCLPPSDMMELSLSRWDANARLIASAPDLLEALISTRDSLQAMADEGIIAQGSWPTIDAAIRKATAPETGGA